VKVSVAPLAAQDLKQAYEFIASRNRVAADRVLASIVETFGLLASKIVLGREVTLQGGQKVRTWALPPYRIYYRLRGEDLQVVRVYHLSRRSIEESE